jgi:putative ABC transport system permease protein
MPLRRIPTISLRHLFIGKKRKQPAGGDFIARFFPPIMPDILSPEAAVARPRESWASRTIGGIAGDLRYALRRLWKEKGFSSLALVTLGLCIGANTAIFSMVYALVLKPLPFPEPGRIVEIYNAFPKAGFNHFPTNVVQYSDFKANAPAFEDVALAGNNTVMVGEEGSAERIEGSYFTAEMFDVLGLKPVIGQFFTLKNCRKGEDQVVVLTESYWKTHYNEDPGVLGKTMRVDGKACQIIGVAPKALEAFNAHPRFVMPYSWNPADVNPQGRYGCSTPMFARLKKGIPVSQGLGEVAGLEQHFYDTADPGFKSFLDRTGHKIGVGLIQVERIEPIKSSLYLLQGGVIFVLLIGCVNVANLLLTRANGQQSELAIRAALGAGRGAIARQLLVESLVLTFAGAVLGISLAYAAVRAMNHFTSRLMPSMLPIEIDGSVLGYTVVVAVVVGLLMGLVPVVHILRSNLAQVIQRSSRSSSGGRGVRALSSLLVTAQIAVALVLLTGAGLLIHSFANAISVDPGFDPKNLVVGSIALPATYRDSAKSATLQQKLAQSLAEIPGIDGVALATGIPFEGGLPILALALKDSLLPRDSPQPGAFLIGVSSDYFKTLRIQLLKGRFLDETDMKKDAPAVYVVDERFEQHYFPGHSALGGHFTFNGPVKKDSDWPVIVGVVRNVPHNGVEDKSNNPFVYYPVEQTSPGGLNIIIRSSRPTSDLISAVREKLQSIDASIPLFETGSLQHAIDSSFDNRRAVMLLLGGFAALALFLSALGIYGVIAYDISQRTREIGIRGAIGATRLQILKLIMFQGLWRTGIGLVVGLVGAVLLSHYMTSMLFELKPTDPGAYITVSLLLALVAAAACYVPARRAAGIDPIEALRNE